MIIKRQKEFSAVSNKVKGALRHAKRDVTMSGIAPLNPFKLNMLKPTLSGKQVKSVALMKRANAINEKTPGSVKFKGRLKKVSESSDFSLMTPRSWQEAANANYTKMTKSSIESPIWYGHK